MLSKKNLAKIRQRFEAGGANGPLRLEGDHLKNEGETISLGWSVYSAAGHGIRKPESGKEDQEWDGQEWPVVYATGTTFDAASFLVHLPVDMANLLEDLEHYHLVLAGLLAGDEEATRVAKRLVIERVGKEREKQP